VDRFELVEQLFEFRIRPLEVRANELQQALAGG